MHGAVSYCEPASILYIPPTFCTETGRVTITGGVTNATSHSTLTINSLRPDDNGTYECIAQNVFGSSRDSVVVEVECKY